MFVAHSDACNSHAAKPPAYSEPELALGRCWNPGSFKLGRPVSGKALAFYSPDGPILVGDVCKRNSLIASFPNADIEQSVLRQMRAESSGRVYGGGLFEITLRGRIIKDPQSTGPLRGLGVSLNQIAVGREVSPPKKVKFPLAPTS